MTKTMTKTGNDDDDGGTMTERKQTLQMAVFVLVFVIIA